MANIVKRVWDAIWDKRSSISIRPGDPAAAELFGVTARSNSGKRVTEDTALNISTVFACVRILAETMATLPFQMMERKADGSEVEVFDHPLVEMINDQPCPELSAFTFFEMMMTWLCLRGNAIAYIKRDGAGRPMELWPIRPDRVMPQRLNGKLMYTVFVPPSNTTGWGGSLDPWPLETYTPVTLPAEMIFHVRTLSKDGVLGLSPVTLMRESMGLAMATEENAARLFGNGSQPGGVLEHPGNLTEEAKARIKKSWEDIHQGLTNAHSIAVLAEGMKFNPTGLPPDDSQFLQSRKFSVEELARPFRTPLHMVASLQNASYATVEQQGIDFATYTMEPWAGRWVKEIRRQLFTAGDRKKFTAHFKMDELRKGDFRSRMSGYQSARQAGVMSVNEIRAKEKMNSIGPEGDIFLQPLNMIPAGQQILKPGGEVVNDLGEEMPATEDIQDDGDKEQKLRPAANPDPEPTKSED